MLATYIGIGSSEYKRGLIYSDVCQYVFFVGKKHDITIRYKANSLPTVQHTIFYMV